MDAQIDKNEILKRFFGYDAFQSGREELVDSLISGRDGLGIMPTGAGKSLSLRICAAKCRQLTASS